jgi:tape measure domain-containing protein
MDMAIRKFGSALASIGLGFSFAELARQVATVRGEFQQLEVAFATMLGNKAEADELMQRTVELAATTPFDLQGVAQGTKQLLAYGSTAQDVTSEIKMLGNIAAGLSLPLGDLVYLYGTTRTQGRLFTQDLRQFMGRGIPLAEELAKQFGVTKDKVGELVTAGKVGFADVQKALVSMTSEGGKFYNLMEEQSKTISGQMSNLGDSIQQMFNEIGKQSEVVISKSIESAAYLVENYEKIGKVLIDVVAAYGSYKAAVMIVNGVIKVRTALLAAETLALRANALAHTNLTKATILLTKALKAMNVTALANPYVLAGVAIAGVIFGIYKLITVKSAEEKALEKVNEKLAEESELLDKEKESAEKYAEVATNINASVESRKAAYENLITVYPELLRKYSEEKVMLTDLAQLNRDVALISEERRLKAMQAQRDDIQRAIDTINSNKGADGQLNAMQAGQLKSLNAELDVVNSKIAKQINLVQELSIASLSKEEQIEYYQAQIDAIDELLASQDKLRSSESKSNLEAQKIALQTKLNDVKVDKTEQNKVDNQDEAAIKAQANARKNAKEEAHKAEMDLQKSYITDEVMLLNLEKEEVLAALQEQIDATNDLVEKGYLERAKKAREALYDNQMDAILSAETERIMGSIGTVFNDTNRIGIQTNPPDLTKIFKEEAEKNIPIITELFGNMKNKTVEDIDKIIEEAEKLLETIEDVEKKKALRDQINNLEDTKDKLKELDSPIDKIAGGFKKLFDFKPNTVGFEEGLSEIRSGLVGVKEAAEFVDGVLDSLGKGEAMDGVIDGLNAAIDAFDAAKQGAQFGSMFGPIGAAAGAALGAVGSLVKSISQIHDKNNEERIQRLQEQIETLENSYDRLGRAVDRAYSTEAADLIEQQNELLKKQIELVKQQRDEEEDKKKTDKDRIKEFDDEIENLGNAIDDNVAKAKEAITGISFDGFYDSFVNTLSDMSSSSEDFADDFEEYLKKSILSALIAEQYKDRIQALYDNFAKANEDGEITQQEIEALRAENDALVNDMIKDRDNLAKAYGWTNDSGDSGSKSSGGFQTMSQETGSELNGRFTDIQGKVTEIRSFVIEMMNMGKMQYAETLNIRDIMIQLNGNVGDIKGYTKVLPAMLEDINTMSKKLDNL